MRTVWKRCCDKINGKERTKKYEKKKSGKVKGLYEELDKCEKDLLSENTDKEKILERINDIKNLIINTVRQTGGDEEDGESKYDSGDDM